MWSHCKVEGGEWSFCFSSYTWRQEYLHESDKPFLFFPSILGETEVEKNQIEINFSQQWTQNCLIFVGAITRLLFVKIKIAAYQTVTMDIMWTVVVLNKWKYHLLNCNLLGIFKVMNDVLQTTCSIRKVLKKCFFITLESMGQNTPLS